MLNEIDPVSDITYLPSSKQQSSPLSKPSPMQLFFPHLRPGKQCESLSQSPSPMLHWLVEVQQESPPLHPVV